MTIFLHGSDGYRRTNRLKEAIRQFLTKYPGVGVRRFDALLDDDVATRVMDIFSSSSLFSPRTLVLVTDALEMTPAQLKLLVEKTSTSETQHLILVAEADKLTKPYARLTEEDVKEEAFPILAAAEWAPFVARELKARDLELSRGEMNILAKRFFVDSWALATELDVLAVMPDELRSSRIDEIERTTPQAAPSWNELRQLGSGDISRRLVTLAYIEASGEVPAKTFAMAAYFGNPRVAADADFGIKTGGWEHDEALLALALG